MTIGSEFQQLNLTIDKARSKLVRAGFKSSTLPDQIDLALEEISKLRRELADLRRPQPMRDWG